MSRTRCSHGRPKKRPTVGTKRVLRPRGANGLTGSAAGPVTRKFKVSKKPMTPKPPGQRKSCTVCGYDQLLNRFPRHLPTAQCKHNGDACRTCLKKWCSSQLQTKIFMDVGCPICPEKMSTTDVKIHAKKEDYVRYKKLSERAAMEAVPGMQWCQSPSCDHGHVHKQVNKPFVCEKCDYKSCVSCGGKWHRSLSCTAATQKRMVSQQNASQRKVKKISKQCPGQGCGANIERTGGCSHMTCSICKAEFCWYCLVDFKQIRVQGGAAHGPKCPNKPVNQPPPLPRAAMIPADPNDLRAIAQNAAIENEPLGYAPHPATSQRSRWTHNPL